MVAISEECQKLGSYFGTISKGFFNEILLSFCVLE